MDMGHVSFAQRFDYITSLLLGHTSSLILRTQDNCMLILALRNTVLNTTKGTQHYSTMATNTTNSSTSPTTTSPTSISTRRDSQHSASSERRTSETWDASKVPPSQFQRPAGSIYATPNSKDGNVERGDRDKAYFEKLKEKVC
jgi:hypothetical protein